MPSTRTTRTLALPDRLGAGLDRYYAGLSVTELLDDIACGPHTLLAPLDAAFAGLPWAFEDLLDKPELVEARFDLFEYLTLPGVHGATGPSAHVATVEGTRVVVGGGMVVGKVGVSPILDTFIWKGALVHVLERCVLPRPLVAATPSLRPRAGES